MSSVRDVVRCIEDFAPVFYQESYDNSGLQVGNYALGVTGVLITLDVTEKVLDEALAIGANLIISHHPLLFGGLKKITGSSSTERIVMKAIRHNLSIYSCHTNIDNIHPGVNNKIATRLGLKKIKVLRTMPDTLCKLVVYVPTDYADSLREVIFEAGAGHIGNYDYCSYNMAGEGTFRASENTTPFVGEKQKLHVEPEIRIETIFPKHLERRIISAVIKAHPYEEVAYDIYTLANRNKNAGAGAYGIFETPMEELDFMKLLKNTFHAPYIRHTSLSGKPISCVALCGGSGSFLLTDARSVGADIFISADFKYHQFFDADNKIIIADIGHFESEQFTLEIFYDLLTKNFSNFAICFTKVKTNPIIYF